jgi:hypothetical protein
MNGCRDVSLEVPLAEGFSGRLTLEMPFLAVTDKDTGSMKRKKDIASECAADVVLAVGFLDMLQIRRVIDNVEAEERNGYLVGRPISLVERIPRLTASSTICLQFLSIPREWLPLGATDP